MDTTESRRVDYRLVLRLIWGRRRLYYIVLPIVFAVSSLFIICIPREYITETSMAPELESDGAGGLLGSVSAMFGLDLADMQTSDAITPLLYPDLMDDNGFVASLFDIEVQTSDGELATSYYLYMKQHQRRAWWEEFGNWVKSLFPTPEGGAPEAFDPYYLSRRDEGLMKRMRKSIDVSVDKKTGVITIRVTAQDALVCKQLADAVREKLQAYITDYRTSKARRDYDYYKEISSQAKQDYEDARRAYNRFADSNMSLVLQEYRSRQEDLENELQLKYNAYSQAELQLGGAKNKIQDKTPAFTTLKGAAVPIKAEKPKRMLFVLGCVFGAFVVVSLYVLRGLVLPKSAAA